MEIELLPVTWKTEFVQVIESEPRFRLSCHLQMLLLLFSPFFLPWRDSDVLEISGETAHLSIFTPSVPAAKVEPPPGFLLPVWESAVTSMSCLRQAAVVLERFIWMKWARYGRMRGSISGHLIRELRELLGFWLHYYLQRTEERRGCWIYECTEECAKRSPLTRRNKGGKYQMVFSWLRFCCLSTRLAQIAAASAFFTLEIKA